MSNRTEDKTNSVPNDGMNYITLCNIDTLDIFQDQYSYIFIVLCG